MLLLTGDEDEKKTKTKTNENQVGGKKYEAHMYDINGQCNGVQSSVVGLPTVHVVKPNANISCVISVQTVAKK